MLRQVIRMIDSYAALHNEMPKTVSLCFDDWEKIYEELAFDERFTDFISNYPNLLVHGVPVVRTNTVMPL